MASTKNRGFLPQSDTGLLTWSAQFKALIISQPANFGLTVAQASVYGQLHDTYASALSACEPGLRNRATVATKNTARAALKKDAGLLASIVQGQAGVTDAQKFALGLNVRKQPTPVPTPTDRPGVDLVAINARTATIHIHDTGSSSKRGKPAGAVAAWVYSYVGATYPSDPTAWVFNGSTSTANFDVVFPDTVAAGSQVWICAAWVNLKQEAGPASVPITTHVQFAAASPVSMKIAA